MHKLIDSEIDIVRSRLGRVAAPACVSPWGSASAAARRLVDQRRSMAKSENRTATKLALRALDRANSWKNRLESVGISLEAFQREVVTESAWRLWRIEWSCGRLFCEADYFEAARHGSEAEL